MRQSIVKIGICNFLNSIKLDKEYYPIYNNIFNGIEIINKEKLFFMILQVASYTEFHGYFDELYLDVIKRKPDYIKGLVYNFEISFIGVPTHCNIIYKYICCGKLSVREQYFYSKMSAFEFDKLLNKYFSFDDIKKSEFIEICENIYNQYKVGELNEQVNIKETKKPSSSKIV